jgi:hypothetical protein
MPVTALAPKLCNSSEEVKPSFSFTTSLMQFLGGGKIQKQMTAIFPLLSFSVLLFLPGCALKRWIFGPSQEAARPSTTEQVPVQPPPGSSGPPSTSLQWDFSQRSGQEQNAPSEPTPPQEAKAESPSPSTPPTPSRQQSLIPGLSDDKAETNGNPQYVTETDLLKVVTEFQRVTTKDTYRFPIPKDVTGANVYKATLTRLQDYEAKHPGAYYEILAFTRGRAYEGLHEYDKAIAQYQIVSQSKNRLNTEAAKAVEVLTHFQEIKQRQITASTPAEYIQALDQLSAAWQEQQKLYAGTVYEALAREEEERLDQAKVTFLLLNRHRLEDGNESVVIAYQQLIDKHKESKNTYRYQVELGDFYFTMAHEYVAQTDPQGLQFDAATFEELGRAALRWYGQVAQEDGVMEKLEAKGKLEALEAYMAKIGRLSR